MASYSFDKIQANILKGHGRWNTALVFVEFGDNRDKIRNFVKSYANKVTSAEKLLNKAKVFREWKNHRNDPTRTKPDGGIVRTLSLGRRGFDRLGIPRVNWPGDAIFRRGMRRRADGTGFYWNTDGWRERFGRRIDALFLLADDTGPNLDDEVEKLTANLRDGVATDIHVHRGARRNQEFDNVRRKTDWFGFRDGFGNPVLKGSGFDLPLREQGLPKYSWDPYGPLELVLVAEPGSNDKRHGSYLAFQKFELNVRRFRAEMRKLAQDLEISTEDASALAIGRRPNGDPLVGHLANLKEKATKLKKLEEFYDTASEMVSKGALDLNKLERFRDVWRELPAHITDGSLSESPLDWLDALTHWKDVFDRNDFNYGNNSKGDVCPFHAHIRKMNPRGESETHEYPEKLDLEEQRSMRIVRRSIPYDDRSEAERNSREDPDSGVGLLFLSYQSELANFVAHHWMATTDDFVEPGAGQDPLLNRGGLNGPGQTWTANGRHLQRNLGDFTRLLGGEYFFTPSISFLEDPPQQ